MTDRPHHPAPPGRPRAGSSSPATGGPPSPGGESPSPASAGGSPYPATGGPPAQAGGSPSPAAGSKTIDTGLRLLEILRDHPDGMTISELARAADVHRNAVSRHLTALRNHRLVSRTGTRFTLGLGIVELGAAVQHRLRVAAEGALQSLADGCRATAFISVLDAEEEVVVLAVAEPRGSDFHVAYRAGKRHAVDRGAPGIAILAGRPPSPGERPVVREARRAGYAVTEGELQPGAWGVAAPIFARGRPAQASIGVVTIGTQDEPAIAPRVVAAAGEIARLL
ncbi:helix-turn-helix domain-containing protein [Actinoallomurus spadix]|uniref:Helix-turn-helix domain-containing protein n=1 Tax=Actinoallomurus spadix TaxID=79912 RepID=A0ABN0VZ91_9ACTN|nr:helix-turn-helix domain-containing protein [Actinoallomurus spadix]MCO5988063.1 helix-turn-helix domain-containing protein [Actinoallomurus spadix]